jgi:PAS domain S-box-containing protein
VNGKSPTEMPRLLVVDDEEGLLFLMLDALRREGFAAEGVDNGRDALKWLEKNDADLLLLDLKLVDLTAPALIEELRKRGQEFPFIIVTGHGDERTAVEMMKKGALDYVMKEAGMLEFLAGNVRRAWNIVSRDRELARANEAVREREERLQKTIQTAMDGFARCSADWRIVETNDALCEMLGYACEELRSLALRDLEVGATNEQLERREEQLREHGFAHWFSRLKRRDGGILEVEISMRRDGPEHFGFIHDLSEQRRLEREVLQISEEERRRFGYELHDSLGQQLTAIELMSHTLARELKEKAPIHSKAAYQIAEFTRQTIAQTRQLAHGLAPVALEGGGLARALADLASVTSNAGVACEFAGAPAAQIADLTVATHLYRMAQEAVNNALRHGRATHISIRCSDLANGTELRIEDDGRGFATKQAGKAGMGLDVMRHRARLIGAQFSVDSRRGKGTRIMCFLPKQP